jgi:sister-chromatid-cohesion protein PDS5
MRLQAAVSLLHLSTVPKFATIISNNLVALAITIQVSSHTALVYPYSSYAQDPCFQVRDEFLRKFITLATHQQLPPHFNVIPFLTIHDPEADIKNMVRRRSLSLRRYSYSPGKSVCFSSISCSTTRFVSKYLRSM